MMWFPRHLVHFARQALCLVICALFVLPTFAVQPALAASAIPQSEERGESKNTENADDDCSVKDSLNQANRRAASQRSLIARSVHTDSARKASVAVNICSLLKDVYQNGLGTRLRC